MNKNLLILGAGIFGTVMKELAEEMGVFEKIDFLDDTYGSGELEGNLYQSEIRISVWSGQRNCTMVITRFRLLFPKVPMSANLHN